MIALCSSKTKGIMSPSLQLLPSPYSTPSQFIVPLSVDGKQVRSSTAVFKALCTAETYKVFMYPCSHRFTLPQIPPPLPTSTHLLSPCSNFNSIKSISMRTAYQPENAILKKYIKYISFYHPEEEKRQLMVFPNPGSAITLYKDHSYEAIEPNVYGTKPTPGEDAQMLQVNRIDPVRVRDEAGKEVVTIAFHPLGVNPFLPVALSGIVEEHGGDKSFIPLKAFGGFAKAVFELADTEQRLKKIEDYLLSKYREQQIPFVGEAIQLLTDLEAFYSIPEICKKIGTGPRNLTRLFNKHICLSPVEFRNIYQFRYSFEKKMNAERKLPFKDIVYESNYTHSSYMVRMYKKYTGLNPSSFFDKVAVEANYVYISL